MLNDPSVLALARFSFHFMHNKQGVYLFTLRASHTEIEPKSKRQRNVSENKNITHEEKKNNE